MPRDRTADDRDRLAPDHRAAGMRIPATRPAVDDWRHIANDWDRLAADARTRWPDLTPADTREMHGDRAQLVARVAERLGMTRAEAEIEVDDWARAHLARPPGSMEWSHIANEWPALAGQARDRWPELTAEELENTRGERPHLVARISSHYGITTAEAEKQADDWAKSL